MRYEEFTIEGRNAVIEAYRAGRPIDKLFILDGCQDGPILTIKREAKAKQTPVKFVTKERLDQLSETGKHQGVIAYAAAYEYATVEEILDNARQKGEAPFLFLLDNIEDPHNLGAIIRTANLAGAHGVIVPKNRAAGLTAVVAKTSAGALKLYSGGKGDEPRKDHRGTQKRRHLVCLCRYGRHDDVRSEFKRADRTCYRQ